MGPEDDIGQPVHCRELSSGRFTTGILTADAKRIEVKLYDYEREVDVQEGAPLHLHTQNDNAVSLHYNFGGDGRLHSHAVHGAKCLPFV